jgi:hypothetical protein
MKKILFLVALGASSCLQANVFSIDDGKEDCILKKNVSIDGSGYGPARTAAAYTALNLGLRYYNVREVAQRKIEGRISNKYAQITAVHLTRAGIDSATMFAGSLLANGKVTFNAKTSGTRLGATTAVNTALSVAEELAQKSSMTKSVVESEVYQSVVRPGLQFFGTNFVINVFNKVCGNGSTPQNP